MKKVLTLSVLLLAASTLGTASALNTGTLAAPTLATFASLKTPVGGPVTNRPIGAVTTARVFVNTSRHMISNIIYNWKYEECSWDEYIVTRIDGVEVNRTWDGVLYNRSAAVGYFAPDPSCPTPVR